MNIKEAKDEIIHTLYAYLKKDSVYLVPSAGNILSILTTGIRTLIVSASNYLTDISWKDFPNQSI